jgi:hypothetical protein
MMPAEAQTTRHTTVTTAEKRIQNNVQASEQGLLVALIFSCCNFYNAVSRMPDEVQRVSQEVLIT